MNLFMSIIMLAIFIETPLHVIALNPAQAFRSRFFSKAVRQMEIASPTIRYAVRGTRYGT